MSTSNHQRRRDSSPAAVSEASARSKRARTSTACAPCRSRKQACSGGQPCVRCDNDGRDCSYGEKESRSPLTRQRMTMLEETVSRYNQLWTLAFPHYDFDAAYEDYQRYGASGVLSKLRSLRPPMSYPDSEVGEDADPPAPGDHGDVQQDCTSSRVTERIECVGGSAEGCAAFTPHDTPGDRTMPPTRVSSHAPSPTQLPALHLDDPSHEVGPSYEWFEDSAAEPCGEADAGMGSLIHGKGMSYYGLSSGAAFLSAIKKLAPASVYGVSPAQAHAAATVGASTQDMGWRVSSTSPRDEVYRGHLPLPPSSEVRSYVEGYFKYYHTITPLVHEPTIRAQVTGALRVPNKPGAAILLNMIFAMGALDIASSIEDPDGSKYFLLAQDALQRDMLKGGTIELVQGLGIMSNYLQSSGRPNAGYMALGWAIRMAMALGLHNPVLTSHGTALEREMRVRVWWGLVTTEAGCSVTFGRPHSIGAFQLDAAQLPINCDDEHLTVVTGERPADVDKATLYTSLVFQSRLARATSFILDHILHSNPTPTLAQLREHDKRIVGTIDYIPAYMSGILEEGPYHLSLRIQSWRIRDFRSILYRPLLLGWACRCQSNDVLSTDVREAIETCRALAVENLQDIQDYVRTANDHSRCVEWYTIFFAFQSCLTLLLSIVAEPQNPSAIEWRQILLSTASWFREGRSMGALGSNYANVLESVLSSVHHPYSADEVQGLAASWSTAVGLPDGQSEMTFDMDRYWEEILSHVIGPPMGDLGPIDDATLFSFNI